MNKKIKILILIIIILLLLSVFHFVRNYIVLSKIYDNVYKFVEYDDNYKFTTKSYTILDEKNTVHSIYEEYVKDNILLVKWEFTPEYTEETKSLNYTSYYWKNFSKNEIIQKTLDSDGNELSENLTTWGENYSNKSTFLLSKEVSKKDFLNNNYWNNIFNFFNKKDDFYTINEQNGNYIKIKTTDNVCELIRGNINITMEQKIELDVVSEDDIKIK